MEVIDTINAIKQLCPAAIPIIDYELGIDESGNYYFTKWAEHLGEQPDISEIETLRIQYEADRLATEYKEKRKREYPPMEDYLDGIVKGDQDQIQEYIDECLAVKAKYPKP